MYNKTTFQWNQLYKKYNKIRKIHNPQSLHILIIQATNLKWSVVSILYNSLTSIIWGIAHLVHVMRYRNGLVHVILGMFLPTARLHDKYTYTIRHV